MQSLNSQNFQAVSKLIEHNKIAPTLLQQNMKKQLERSRSVYDYPASIGAAKLHRLASKFGYRKSLKDRIPVVCPCCQLRIENQPVPICYSTTSSSVQVAQNYEQFKLPSGIAVYFSLLKATIVLCFIFSLSSIYVLVSVSACQLKDILPDFSQQICKSTTSNLAKENGLDLNVVNYLYLGALAASILYFLVYRCQKNSWHRFIHSKNLSQDSYAVLISNIPILDFPNQSQVKGHNTQFFYRKHLEQYLQHKIKAWVQNSAEWSQPADSNEGDFLELLKSNEGELKSREIVKSISLCYNLNRLEIIDESIQKLMEQNAKLEEESNELLAQVRSSITENRFATIPKKIDFINDCRLVLNKQFAEDNSFLFNLTHFVGHAFVSFQYQHYKKYFLQAYDSNSKEFIYNGNFLSFAQAAHPSDINWKNLRLSNDEKNRLHLNSYFLIALVLLLEFLVLYVLHTLLYNRNSLINAPFAGEPKVFLLVATALIVVTQFILRNMVSWLVKNEKHKSKVNQCTAYILKSVIAQSSAAVIPLFLLNMFLASHGVLHFYANNFIFWSCVQEIVFWLINPVWLAKEVRKWWRYRLKKSQDEVEKFQIQLNRQFQLPEYDIKSRYAYYLQKIYVCGFFSYQAPTAVVVTFFALVFMFWVDKTNLFKRSSLYNATNIVISYHALRMLQVSLFAFAFSFFYFSSNQLKNVNLVSLLAFVAIFIYVLFVLGKPEKLQRLFFGREAASNAYRYDDCVAEGKFNKTYWSQNPSTCLIQQRSISNKQTVTNPALMRQFGKAKDYEQYL